MLKSYPDDKMFAAAKAIVERDGDTFDRADFECDVTEVDDTVSSDDDDLDDGEPEVTEVEPEPKVEAPKVEPRRTEVAKAAAPKQSEQSEPNVGEVAELLARLMASGKKAVDPEQVKEIAATVFRESRADAMDVLMAEVNKAVTEGLKTVKPRELLIKTERSEVKVDGLQHFNFETLLRTCSATQPDGHRLNVWLYGPPGTGKTTAARNAAKALSLPFYCTGSLLTKYDITGFIDAAGNLVRSTFREAWENGGVFLFDEIDGSAVAAIVAFNAALANGVMAFPDGMIERHANCVIIAAANTTGQGATAEFNGRMKMDMATIDRFVMLEWPIDEAIESALASDKRWAALVQITRANVTAKGIKGVAITPRATIAGCALLASGLDIKVVTKMVLQKSMSAEQWAMVS